MNRMMVSSKVILNVVNVYFMTHLYSKTLERLVHAPHIFIYVQTEKVA